MATKNVILKDSSSNELRPETVITQVKDSSGSDLFTEASGVVSTTNGHSLNGASIGDSTITSSKLAFKSHNSMLRGRDITSYFQDGSLWDRIHGTNGYQKFDDLYLGDYFNMGQAVTCPDSYSGTTGSQYCVIAGFNCLYGNGDSNAVTYDHIICVPGTGDIEHDSFGTEHFGRHAMNGSNTTAGGYAGSVMHTTVYGADQDGNAVVTTAGTINAQLYAIFGSHLKATRELLSNSINSEGYNRFGSNTGCSNNWAWYTCYAVNMSEVEVYGTTIWSSSGYDTGTAKERLPLFALSDGAINDRSSYYWLKDVASASAFAIVDSAGFADSVNAGYEYFYVRPRFVLS